MTLTDLASSSLIGHRLLLAAVATLLRFDFLMVASTGGGGGELHILLAQLVSVLSPLKKQNIKILNLKLFLGVKLETYTMEDAEDMDLSIDCNLDDLRLGSDDLTDLGRSSLGIFFIASPF